MSDASAVAGSNREFQRRAILFLLPGIYQAILPLLTLPLTTRILGPADFALFSVVSAISVLLTTISQLGSGFILAQRFPTSRGDQRRRLVSTIFFQCLFLSSIFAVLVILVWPVVQVQWAIAADITETMVTLVMIAMVGTSLYTLVAALATFGYAPGYFSAMTILKATVAVASTLISLFVFDAGVLSLFVGLFAAGVFDLIGSTLFMMPFLRFRFDGEVARDCLFLGGWNSFAQLSMQGRQLLERSVLSSTVGLHDLGLFVHAQQYQNISMLGSRPIQQAMVPVMLEEARAPGSCFPRTARITRVLFLALTMLAVTFAVFGELVIHILTNGKFDAAAPYAALLIAAILIQSLGRPQFARLMSQGKGRYLSACNIVAVAVAALLLIVLAPHIGVAAAVASIYVQYGLYRIGIEFDAVRAGRLPFQDMHGIAGLVLVGAIIALVQIGEPEILVRSLLLVAGLALAAALYRSVIGDLATQVRAFAGAFVGSAVERRLFGRPQSSREEGP